MKENKRKSTVMSETLYMVTISSGSLVDSMAFDNKAQAEAAVEYFKLYYDEECYVRDIEISEITIDTDDYISKLNEYKKQLIEENLRLKSELREYKDKIDLLKNTSSKEMTNVDMLRRISSLEKVVFGDKNNF